MSGDIFGCYNWRMGAVDIKQVDIGVLQCTGQLPPTMKNYPAPNVNNSGVENDLSHQTILNSLSQ